MRNFLSVDIAASVAVCDPFRVRRENAAKLVKDAQGHDPKQYNDFRDLLADKSIDAVVIASPDHWHVPLGLAAVRRDQEIRLYGILLAAIGVPISIWHLLVERFPTLEGTSCDPANPCSIIWIERFGFLTIPAMALSGFVAIIALLSISPPSESS